MRLNLKPTQQNNLSLTGRPVRVGILGYSDIARRKFIPALTGCHNAALHAVASRNRDEAAHSFPENLITSYEELLKSSAVELIYLSLPNHLHEEWSIKTLEAGKHLICEKPLATSLASAEKILASARSNARLVYENQMFLFHPQHERVKTMIEQGEIGEVRELRSFFGFPFPQQGNFRLDPLQGGGAFHDLARYPLGIATYLLRSKPADFRGHATWRDGLNTSVTGTAITPDDELFTFSIRFGQQYEASYEVIGEKGSIRLERAYTTPAEHRNLIVLTVGTKTTEIAVPATDHFKRMLEQICQLIQTGSDYSYLNSRALAMAELAAQMQQGCMGEQR